MEGLNPIDISHNYNLKPRFLKLVNGREGHGGGRPTTALPCHRPPSLRYVMIATAASLSLYFQPFYMSRPPPPSNTIHSSAPSTASWIVSTHALRSKPPSCSLCTLLLRRTYLTSPLTATKRARYGSPKAGSPFLLSSSVPLSASAVCWKICVIGRVERFQQR